MKHLKVHLGPNVYSCSMCSQSFAKYKQLKEHKMEHYKNDANLVKEIRKKEEAKIDQDEVNNEEDEEDEEEENFDSENNEYLRM